MALIWMIFTNSFIYYPTSTIFANSLIITPITTVSTNSFIYVSPYYGFCQLHPYYILIFHREIVVKWC